MFRKQQTQIIKDLEKKIVFIVGPRQVGKTWLAKEVAKMFPKSMLLNYDSFEDRQIIQTETWANSTELLIFDELHKMKNWKNFLKGVFDTKPTNQKILVTGSARLDTFRQSGDSLAGRFFTHRLLPFSLSETYRSQTSITLERLIERSGFPEPLLADKTADAKRWRNQFIDGLLRQDILDFGHLNNLYAIKSIFELLRRRVGSPVSYASIAQDVKISPTTVEKYVNILEALFIIFKIHPFSKNIARSLLKTPKIYFYDNGLVEGDAGQKFENFVALSLLKHIYAVYDEKGDEQKLCYLRTKEKKEVDFCLTQGDKIKVAIEAKFSFSKLSKNLAYFCKKYDLAGIQIVQNLKRERSVGSIDIVDAESYLQGLYL